MPSGNLEGIAVVGRASCGAFGSANSERALFLTRDGGSPNLLLFDMFPCDCTGAENEMEFDACTARGDLGGGCACLDKDLDGDVDCDDFTPPISAVCEEPASLPALGGWGRAIVALLILAACGFSRVRMFGKRS